MQKAENPSTLVYNEEYYTMMEALSIVKQQLIEMNKKINFGLKATIEQKIIDN